MRKPGSIAFKILTLTLSLILLSPALKSSAAPLLGNNQILLKLNQYYVAYTAPQAPYLDENNRLMVPLRSIADLTHSQAAYAPNTKSVTLTRKNVVKEPISYTKLQVTLGSQQAVINGKSVSMDTKPVLLRGSVFVPLGIVAQAFDLDLGWDRQQNVVTLREDPAYLPSNILMDESYVLGQHTVATLQPVRLNIEMDMKQEIPLAHLNLTVRNLDTKPTSSKPYLHTYIWDSHFTTLNIINNKPIPPNGTATFAVKQAMLPDSLRYILIEPCQN